MSDLYELLKDILVPIVPSSIAIYALWKSTKENRRKNLEHLVKDILRPAMFSILDVYSMLTEVRIIKFPGTGRRSDVDISESLSLIKSIASHKLEVEKVGREALEELGIEIFDELRQLEQQLELTSRNADLAKESLDRNTEDKDRILQDLQRNLQLLQPMLERVALGFSKELTKLEDRLYGSRKPNYWRSLLKLEVELHRNLRMRQILEGIDVERIKTPDDFLKDALGLYPWVRQQILDAETLSGIIDHVTRGELLNALDDFLMSFYYWARGDKNQAVQEIEAFKSHLLRSAHQAWLTAAALNIERLEDSLGTLGIKGQVDYAYEHLKKANEFLVQSRSKVYARRTEAIPLAKKAAKTASDGLAQIRVPSRSFLIYSVVTLASLVFAVISIVLLFLKH